MKKVFEPLTHTSEYDPKLDPSTFVFPGHSGRTSITIEFCDKVGLLKLSRRVLKLKYWPVSLVSTILYYQVPATFRLWQATSGILDSDRVVPDVPSPNN